VGVNAYIQKTKSRRIVMKKMQILFLGSLSLLMLVSNSQVLAKSSSLSDAVSDSAITANIKAQFGKSNLMNASDIHVKTNDAIVTLSGVVDSNTQASTAVEIAESSKGVKDVEAKDLTVKDSHQPMEDTYITAKVKGAILKEELFNNKNASTVNVHVETQNGTVYLSGDVLNKQQAKQAVKVAKSIHGVKGVVSHLTMSRGSSQQSAQM